MADASVLHVENLVAGYGGADTLRGIHVTVGRNQIVFVLGPNGAGKSTLLKAIYGQARVRRGSISVDCGAGVQDITGMRASSITRLGVNFVPQRQNVFPSLSVEDNLELGGISLRHGRARVRELFDLFPLLATRRRQRAGTLSGGERQLLAVARALMTSPRVLLLDEPSAALAPIAARLMFDQLERVRGLGVAILLVEQNARQALALSDYAYILDTGETALEGAAANLLDDKRVDALYLGGHLAEAGDPAPGTWAAMRARSRRESP
jgi:branched-chain amino acid transport system ATP-binding protein